MIEKMLGNLVKIKTGKLNANASDENGLYPFFTCAKKISRINKFAFDSESVLVAGNGELNVKYYEGKFNAYQRTYVIDVIDKKQLSTKYVYYFLDKYIQKLRDGAIGGVIKYIKLNHLTNIQIPIPDIHTQNKIVDVLDRANSLVKKREQTIDLLDELLRATFLDMFGDLYFNDKNFKYKTINDLCEVQGGLQVSHKRKTNPIEIKYLRVANVYRDKLDLKEIKNIRATEAEIKRTLLEKGDILVIEGHGNINEIGRSAIWNSEIENMIHQNHLIRIRVKSPQITITFLNAFINSNSGKYIMKSISNTTSGLNTISTGKVKSIRVPIPPIELQKNYNQIQTFYLNHLKKIESSKTKSINFFLSLTQKVFKGELNFNIDFELDALVREINLEKKQNDLSKIVNDIAYLQRLVDKLNEQEFEEKEMYDKAKHAVFQLLKEDKKVTQKYNENDNSVKLVLK